MDMLFLLLFPLLVAGGFYIAYAWSSAAAARKRASKAVQTLEALDREVKAQDRRIQETVSEAAVNYAQEVRIARLRAVPVEELRRQASGMRLQPLKDAGLQTLADLQGWSRDRLAQLRGVGPKSAGTIAYAAGTLISQSNALPIPHPLPASEQGRGRSLLQAIYILRWVQVRVPKPQERLLALIQEFRRRANDIKSNTGFIRWVSSLGKHPEIRNATAEAHALAGELQGDKPSARLRTEISELLTTVRTLQSNGIELGLIAKDCAENQDDYVRVLSQQLGAPPESVSRRASAAAVEPVTIRTATPPPGAVTKVPSPAPSPNARLRAEAASAVWVPPNKDVTVAGFVIKGGMVYVGSGLASVRDGRQEPALIDPSLPVAKLGADCHTRKTDYWPTYGTITPEARASYLQWLTTGKSDPHADIGYVFLYFYGLERRALADSLHDPRAKAELPVIEQEIRRLLGIYTNGSFCSYANSLLDYLTVRNTQLESLSIPRKSDRSWELSLDLRIGLGLHAKGGLPLPPDWALAWYLSAPEVRRGVAVTRCADAFAALFKIECEKRFGAGLKLPVNKTRIKVPHRTASLSFAGESFTAEVDIPDVSVLGGPVAKLQEVGNACAAALAPYSRYLAANPDKAASREALLLLPVAVWPDPFRTSFLDLRNNLPTDGQPKLMRLRDILAILPPGEELNKARYASVTRVLGGMGLGIEPDVRLGGNLPQADDAVVLFHASGLDQEQPPSDGFTSAALTLQMAALVASGDGTYQDGEAKLLADFVGNGLEISQPERQRLVARLELYQALPPSPAGLKKRIQTLGQDARNSISAFLLQIAVVDGVVEPGEVKALENLFGLLGLDQGPLYSKLHELEAQTSPAQPASDGSDYPVGARKKVRTGGLTLDASRIAALKADSARVSALLGNVFSESAPTDAEGPPFEDIEQREATLLDLDTDHAGLLQVLLQRVQWTRGELEELCSDRGLMLDGAIERINEAAFTRFDQPLIEGDDPLDVNSQLVLEGNTA